MKLTSQSYSNIEQALSTVWNLFPEGNEPMAVTDIYIQPKCEAGELCIYNDDDKELARVAVDEWADEECTSEEFYRDMQAQLGKMLDKCRKEGTLDRLSIMKPFSIVLVDEEKETVAELMLVDDDTMVISDNLLQGLDEELDEFLKNLLEE